MPYTADVTIDDTLSDFISKNIAPECDWAAREDVFGGYIEDLVGYLLGEEDVKGNVEVSVSLVGTDRIHELNKEFRNIDSPTDVLSFPCDDPKEVDEEVVELGDIVVSPEIAFKQAKDYGNTYVEEMTLLLTHGILHLLGYDHIEDADAEKMESRERELRSSWEKIK